MKAKVIYYRCQDCGEILTQPSKEHTNKSARCTCGSTSLEFMGYSDANRNN